MTQYTIKTNETEADRINKGDQSFVLRKGNYFKGDKITFLLIKNNRPIYHDVCSKTFEVTMVLDSFTAPIDKGIKLVAFRRVA